MQRSAMYFSYDYLIICPEINIPLRREKHHICDWLRDELIKVMTQDEHITYDNLVLVVDRAKRQGIYEHSQTMSLWREVLDTYTSRKSSNLQWQRSERSKIILAQSDLKSADTGLEGTTTRASQIGVFAPVVKRPDSSIKPSEGLDEHQATTTP